MEGAVPWGPIACNNGKMRRRAAHCVLIFDSLVRPDQMVMLIMHTPWPYMEKAGDGGDGVTANFFGFSAKF